MNKEFDCVEMKRKGAEILQKKIESLSLEDEIKFWDKRNKALLQHEKKIVRKIKHKTKSST